MSTPYWGQLPGPKVAKNRRWSEEIAPTEQQRYSADSQPQRQPNRGSVMTANTESTFSPSYETPPESGFHPDGLAPRPVSYSRRAAAQDQPLDIPKTRSSRRSHDMDDDADAAPQAPPIAPEAPRRPPMSYRHPQGNGGLPYNYASTGDPRPPRQAASNPIPTSVLEAEEYYRSRSNGRGAALAQRPIDEPPTARNQEDAYDYGAVPPRRSSASGPSERRKKFAVDRSPLQRLELTLDSMTKEEKRARVEAAEHRARDRAARRASETAANDDDYGRVRRESVSRDVPRTVPQASAAPVVVLPPASREAPVRREASGRRPIAPAQPPPESGRGYPPSDQQFVERQPSQRAQPAQAQRNQDSGIPRRNLSFRERAVQDDVKLPYREDVGPVTQPQAPVQTGGFALSRSGSNKIRKDPPGDPWYHRRMDAEAHRMAAAQEAAAAQSQPPRRRIPPSAVDKELPPAPQTSRSTRNPAAVDVRATSAAAQDDDLQGFRRSTTDPVHAGDMYSDEEQVPTNTRRRAINFAEQAPRRASQDVPVSQPNPERQVGQAATGGQKQQHVSIMLPQGRDNLNPGQGVYKPPRWLEEWRKGTVGTLAGNLLELDDEQSPTADRGKTWWEEGGHRRSSSHASRPRRAEAFDGEYDDTKSPTRFKPALYVQCGPLLRYCGIRYEKIPVRSARGSQTTDKEYWRGSVMIVTSDSDSSYDIAPTLRLFVQNIELLPPPPHQIDGDLSPEYVDPIAGHPKLGRKGETLYVRPVEHLEEAKDLSQYESDAGLFETSKSPPDVPPADGSSDLPGSFANRRRRVGIDGEKMQKYKDVRGFRLHAERGCTFWRFNIEVELQDVQQRIAYRINRGPAMGFWVPAKGHMMNIMFHSCNGFSSTVNPNDFCGPDPMWRDVLNTHQTKPFHVMIGGGDQIYNDSVSRESELFDNWLDIRESEQKRNEAFSAEMQDQLETFYLERYCKWFSQGLFSLATSQIPMVNMLDDHDIYDGYGSYPNSFMSSPVMSGLGAVAFKYYMLFQHQSVMPETEASEQSWIFGVEPGPYIKEQSRSIYMSMGAKVALLAVDCRTERTEHDIVQDKTWEKIMNRLYAEIRRGQVEHLLVLLSVPVAYPRLVWLENILTSRLMDPVKALGKTGLLGKALNSIDDGAEVLDDLNDHWSAKNHKQERSIVIEDLQDLSIDKSLRITLLSGDVNLAAVGQFYSNAKLGLPKHKDPRYMPNIISSAIANAPPPDVMADVLNRRNKVHHFDKQTDEAMIPVFHHGVDGKSRNNKTLLPHRNWCSIREWAPGSTPPPTPPASNYERTPPASNYERTPSPPPSRARSLLRRISGRRSSSSRADAPRDSVRGPRPPISNGGGLFRSFSRQNRTNADRPQVLTRTMSLDRDENPEQGQSEKRGFFSFGRRGARRRPDDGGINGTWGGDSDDEYYDANEEYGRAQPSGLRGGLAEDEYSEGDEEYFSAQPPRRAQTMDSQPGSAGVAEAEAPPRRPFHRTPTGLSEKQMRNADAHNVDVEGALDVCLNVEVNPKDPTGITVPYRILVPKLFYEYSPGVDALPQREEPGRFKRLLSMRRGNRRKEMDQDLGPEEHEAE